VEDRRREQWSFVRNYGIRTVIDVGANVGQFALLMADLLPGVTILSFEPLAECCATLKAALATVPDTHCFQVALESTKVACRCIAMPSLPVPRC
jgi:FkbM family methyltransferase